MEQIKKLVIDLLLFEKGKAYGFQEYILNLLNYLYRNRNRVLYQEIILVCQDSQKEHFSLFENKFKIIGYPCRSMRQRFYIQSYFPKQLRLNYNDLLISPGNYTGLFKCCRIILVIHDLLFKRKELLPKPLMRLQRNIFLPISINYADTIITISEFSYQDVISYYPKAKTKAVTIYNYFNFEKFQDAPESEYHDYFLSVCSEEAHKNTITVLNAFEEYCQKGGTRNLILVGKIKDGAAVSAKLQSMNGTFSSRIITCSHISNKELASLYKGADAYISASLFEGLGMPIVEAMHFNLPVILSDIPVLHEISLEEGIYFNPLDYHNLSHILLSFNPIKRNYSEAITNKFSTQNTSERYLQEINKYYLL